MDFYIISLGNVEFLSMVLNGVAMICGTGDYARLVAVGFVIGLIYIGFQCIFEGGQRINLHHTLLCFLCYLCFFGPSCTVVIEDAYTGTTRTVDNLPLGVGVAGTAISGIGYGLTRMMEQGYSTYDRTSEHQFAEPLRLLNKLRTVAETEEIFNTINRELGPRGNGAASDSKQALVNYLSECTMAKIQLGATNPTRIYMSNWTDGEFQFNSEAHTVYLPISGVGGDEVVTCKDGYAKLNVVFQKLSTTPVRQTINSILHLKNDDGTAVATDFSRVDGALAALNATMNGSQDLVQTIIVEAVYNQAAQKYYTTQQDYASAIAVNQAIAQRNTQWASEGTMFLNAARALMAFFEGFVYAITPVVGFLIAVGSFGVGLVGKYFLTVVWIQLWLPILSILNLYIMTGARHAIVDSHLGASSSFYALDTLYQETQTWLSTGGMLTAATPMLALFLVTGSTYAFTALAGRLGGQDHYNERINTPDVVSPSAVMSHQPHVQSNRVQGVATSGAREVMPSDNFSTAFNATVSSKAGAMVAQSELTTAQVTQKIASGQSSNQTDQFLQSVGESMQSTRNESHQAALSKFKSTAESLGFTAQQTQAAVAEIGAAIQASGGIKLGSTGRTRRQSLDDEAAKKGEASWIAKTFSNVSNPAKMILGAMGLSVEVEGTLDGSSKNVENVQSGQSHGSTAQRALNSTEAKQLLTGISENFQSAVQNMSSDAYSKLASLDKSSDIGQQFSKMASARRDYEEADSVARSFGSSQSINRLDTSEQLKGTRAGHVLADFERRFSPGSRERRELNAMAQKYGGLMHDSEQGRIAAAIGYMMDHKEHHAELGSLLMQSRLPTTSFGGVDPDRNRGLERPGNVDNFVAAHREVQKDQADRIQGSDPGKVDIGRANDKIESKHREHSEEVTKQATKDDATAMQPAKDRSLEALINGSQDGIGIKMASTLMRDGFVGSFTKWLTNQSPIDLPNVVQKNLGDYLNDQNRTISGLTTAQENYMTAYHSYRHMGGTDNEKVKMAAEGVRQEMRTAMFGSKENLTAQETHKLDVASMSMISGLHHLYEVDNQGLTTQITNFNTAHGLKADHTSAVNKVK